MKKIQAIVPIFVLLVLPGMFTASCETNRGRIIPYVEVDLYLLIYADLTDLGIGGTKVFTGYGYRGIVLYRESDLEFRAYDLTCTRFPEHDAAVEEDPGFFGVFECPECGSTFLLMNGAEPNSGPARYPLVEYQTSIQGDVLHIFN